VNVVDACPDRAKPALVATTADIPTWVAIPADIQLSAVLRADEFLTPIPAFYCTRAPTGGGRAGGGRIIQSKKKSDE
jgi:hypothetical protein